MVEAEIASLYHQALRAVVVGDSESALKKFERLVSEAHHDRLVPSLVRLARLEEERGNYDSAKAHLERVVAFRTKGDEGKEGAEGDALLVLSAHHELSRLLLRSKQFDAVAKQLEALPLPNDAPAAVVAGRSELIHQLLSESPSSSQFAIARCTLPFLIESAAAGDPDPLLGAVCTLIQADALERDEIEVALPVIVDSLEASGPLEPAWWTPVRKLAQSLTARGHFYEGSITWALLRRELRRALGGRHPSALAASIGRARCLLGLRDRRRGRRLLRAVARASKGRALEPIRRSAQTYLLASLKSSK